MIFFQGMVSSILVLLVGRRILRKEVSWKSLVLLFFVYFVAQFILQVCLYGTDFYESFHISFLIGCVSVVGAVAYFFICLFYDK